MALVDFRGHAALEARMITRARAGAVLDVERHSHALRHAPDARGLLQASTPGVRCACVELLDGLCEGAAFHAEVLPHR